MGNAYIADRIRRLRKARGWSVDVVGLAVGRSGKSVSAWETGRSAPSAEMLVDLCEVFGVTIEYFFPPEVVRVSNALRADERELLELYRSLDASGREMALCAVRGMASHEHPSHVAEGKLA